MVQLAHRTVLVVGASGGIGEEVTRTLLATGATVIAQGRSTAKLQALCHYTEDLSGGRLVTFARDFSTSQETNSFATHLLNEFGQLDGLVISMGDWSTGGGAPLLQVTDEAWEKGLQNNLTSHFYALRALVPLVRPHLGAVVHLSGYSSDIPYPKAAPVSATNAGRKMLLLTMAEELAGQGPRFYELIIGMIRTRPRKQVGIDNEAWYQAEEIGQYVARLIEGEDTRAQKTLHYLTDRGSTPPSR